MSYCTPVSEIFATCTIQSRERGAALHVTTRSVGISLRIGNPVTVPILRILVHCCVAMMQ